MKKKLIVCVALVLGLALLAGCAKNAVNSAGDRFSKVENEVIYDESLGNAYWGEKNESGETGWFSTDCGYDSDREKKLVYTANMVIETLKYEECVNSVRELITKYNGFLQSESERDNANGWYQTGYVKNNGTLRISMSIRIPTENYDTFLKDLQGSGKVVSRSATVDNITKRYYETETTIQSLKIQEERLLGMMAEAKDISEMLKIEERLTEVQTELAQYKNALASMDSDVQYSTVNLEIKEVVEYSEEETVKKTSTFGDRLKNTLEEAWEGLQDFGEGTLFFFIYALPYLLLFVVIPGVILIVVLKKKRKKRADK